MSKSNFDLNLLISAAIKSANSSCNDDVDQSFFDILLHLKNLSLSGQEIRISKAVHCFSNLREHGNPRVRTGVTVLLDSWTRTLYASGRNTFAISLTVKKPKSVQHIAQILTPLKVPKNPNSFQSLKSVGDKTIRFDPTKIRLSQSKSDAVQVYSNLKNRGDERPQNLARKESALPTNLKKKPPLKDSGNPKYCPNMKKNSTELLELFEKAKKSADVANAKGLLFSKAESSTCVEILSLLIRFTINSKATETRRIMERLENLTKYKDRKICHAASALLYHWRQNIKDQQCQDSTTKTRKKTT